MKKSEYTKTTEEPYKREYTYQKRNQSQQGLEIQMVNRYGIPK